MTDNPKILISNISELNNYIGNLNIKYTIKPGNIPLIGSDPQPPLFNQPIDTNTTLESNIVTYNIKKCTPQLLSQNAPVNNKCNDGRNGSIKFNFNRPLEVPDEYMVLRYNIEGEISPYNVQINALDTTTNSYTLNNLPAGNYTNISFISSFAGNAVGTKVDATSFTITAPDSVTFSTTQQNVLCYGVPSGTITVTAQGGTNNLFYSKDAGSTWQSNNVFNGLTAGTYGILVKDVNQGVDCIAPQGIYTATISQPSQLTVVLDTSTNTGFENPSSNISNDGFINISVTGGTSSVFNPYTIVWTKNGQPVDPSNVFNEDLTDLQGDGLYTVTVTDSNSCVATLSQTIDAPEPITATFTVEQIKCFGGKGKITATVSGGNAGAYQYFWTPSTVATVNDTNTSNISNLNAGTYTLRVVDSKNVSLNFPAITIAPAPSEINIAGLQQIYQKCYQVNSNTVIDISVAGGVVSPTSNYTFKWYNTNDTSTVLSTNEDLINIAPGNYKVIVTDNNNCTKEKTFTVIAATQIQLTSTPTITNIIDPGTNTGSINITGVTGGTTPYSYLWSNGATTQNILNVAAGTYFVTITDSNNCSIQSPNYTITSPDTFTINISIDTPIKCFGEETGQLTVFASGGTPNLTGIPYTYFWENSIGSFLNPTSTISSLPAGTYTITVRDFYNVPRYATIILTQPSAITTTFTKTNVTCNGLNNGSITINASGGVAPYSYKFNNELFATTSNVRNNLSPGVYSCTVTDANNCQKIINNIQITQPAVLSINTANITPVSIIGLSDGAIAITVVGGTTPYTYAWQGTSSNTATPTGLPEGIYTVTVTDANGCTITATYTITTILPLTAQINQTQPILCFGANTGALQIIPAGGRPNYTFLWSNGATSPTISGLPAGVYTAIVSDSNTPQSTISATYTITQPVSALTANVISQTNVTCYGLANGSATVTGSGGTAPYSYVWKNALSTTIGTTSSIISLPNGTYTCTITDSNTCVTTQSVTITQPNVALSVNVLSINNVNIFGQSTGAITTSVAGGTDLYTFNWSNGATTQNIQLLPAGTYSLTVTDANGCTIQTGNIVVSQNPLLVANITETIPNSIICNGGNTGSLTAIVNGGAPNVNVSYVWTKNGDTAFSRLGNPVNNLSAGIYSVTVSDSYTSTTAIYTLTEPNVISVTFTSTPASCSGAAVGSLTANVTGGTAPYTYEWFNGTTSQTVNNLSSGSYGVKIKDSKGCETNILYGSVTAPGNIVLNPVVVNGSCNTSSLGSISFAPTGGSGNFSIVWNNNSLVGFVQNNLPQGTYTGIITDTAVGGCTIPFSYTISGATPILVDLGGDVVLCNNQNVSINGTAVGNSLTYAWTSSNGFTSSNPIVSLTAPGTYTLTVTNVTGCSYKDDFVITGVTQSIDANYLVASQTYKGEEIVLVNVSDKTNTTYTWVFPAAAQVISQNEDTAIVKFENAGIYSIGLKGLNTAGCIAVDFSDLVVDTNTNVAPNNDNTILVKKFQVSPNPVSVGNSFSVIVELALEQPLTISVYSLAGGGLITEVNLPINIIHEQQYNMPSLSSGLYYIIIKTPGTIQGKKLIIQ